MAVISGVSGLVDQMTPSACLTSTPVHPRQQQSSCLWRTAQYPPAAKTRARVGGGAAGLGVEAAAAWAVEVVASGGA